MSTQEATAEFSKLLDSDYYSHDRSTNTAEDYTENKEQRDMEASIEYAGSDEFHAICVEKGLING